MRVRVEKGLPAVDPGDEEWERMKAEREALAKRKKARR